MDRFTAETTTPPPSDARRSARAWRALPLAAAVAAAAHGGLLTAAGSWPADNPANLAPPLPAQPATTQGTCTPQKPETGAWTLLQSASPAVNLPWEIHVDPWMPCRMYRVTSPQTVDRSSDSGQTWQRVFEDHATSGYAVPGDPGCLVSSHYCLSPSTARQYTMTNLYTPAQDTVAMTEEGNGDALVMSTTGGRDWTLGNGTVPTIAGQLVSAAIFTRSDPATVYAVVTPFLYVTRDSGAHWSPTLIPAPLLSPAGLPPLIVTDPADAGHVLWLQQGYETVTVLSSTDYGQTASVIDTIQNAEASRLLATHTSRHGLRVYILGQIGNANAPSNLVVSDDGGSTWQYTPTPSGLSNPAVIADPVDGDRMLFTGAASTSAAMAPRINKVYLTTDGFDTLYTVPGPPQEVSENTQDEDPLSVKPPALQADAAGNFYLTLEASCTGNVSDSACPPSGTAAESFWRYAPPPPPPLGPPQPKGSPQGFVGPPPVSAAAMVEVARCPLGLPSTSTQSGSLAFDGRDLLYSESGETGPAPYEGRVHRLRTDTCRDDGDLLVRFPPTIPGQTGTSSPTWIHPVITDLTYDLNRNALWVTVNNGYTLLVHAADMRSTPAIATATFPFSNGCGVFLSYAWWDDSLWTCDGTYQPGHIRASDGSTIPGCGVGLGSHGTPTALAAWTVVAPGILDLQDEDDTTIDEYDATTCAHLRTLTHRPFAEPTDENEQLTCDGVTMGAPATAAVAGPVIWIRDLAIHSASAYAVPDGYCPLRTAITLTTSMQTPHGMAVAVCADLRAQSFEGPLPLGQERLHLTVDATPLAPVVTDAAGQACAQLPGGLTGRHALLVRFDGTRGASRQYLASAASGTLDVLGAVSGGHGTQVVLAATAPQPPSPPRQPDAAGAVAANGQPDVAAQAQAQAQAETQAQSGAQTVGQVQPATMLQRRTRIQVAAQTSLVPTAAASALLATALRQRVIVVELAMTLAAAAALPRRRLATARRRRA